MSRSDADDRWIVSLLDVQPADRVLDVGFGPGLTMALIAERATEGLAAGVDPSEVMLRQATEHNRAAIEAGRVELRLGEVSHLPYPDAHFTKACAVHTVPFWPSLEQGLREIGRVLAPNGLLVLGLRMRREGVGRLNPSRYGFTGAQLTRIIETLSSLGFRNTTTQRRYIDRQTLTAVLTHR